jgi:hypothetical protein
MSLLPRATLHSDSKHLCKVFHRTRTSVVAYPTTLNIWTKNIRPNSAEPNLAIDSDL